MASWWEPSGYEPRPEYPYPQMSRGNKCSACGTPILPGYREWRFLRHPEVICSACAVGAQPERRRVAA